jgi:geranylgeranyl diphosphate synthase type I
MSLKTLSQEMLPAIEEELRRSVAPANGDGLDELHAMLAYHMGWQGEGAGAPGKRIRPLLLLLVAASAPADWRLALPAAAAVELIHNFSLIHDDIEDNSPLRRGRSTVWRRWGVPQALNAGDSMFTLAHLALLRLDAACPAPVVLEAARLLQQACLHLTQGQYLDISYEGRRDLSVEAYWPMVSGKTAALLGACTGLGALIGGASLDRRAAFLQFGQYLGLAFQAQDDLLGVWGDAALTGKSADSDLVSGKKSLPVLYALGQNGAFARRWQAGPIAAEEAAALAAQMDAEGARLFTQQAADRLTAQALQALHAAQPASPAAEALDELAAALLNRNM